MNKLVQLLEPSSQFDYGAVAKERICHTQAEVDTTIQCYRNAIKNLGFKRHTIMVKEV